MKSFHVSPDQRQHIIQEARHVLSDGTPRTAFQLAQAFQHRGRLPSVGTLAITTVLTTTPDFRYDTASDCFRLTAGLRPAGGPALTPTSPAPPPASAPPAPRFQRMQRIRLRAQPQRQGRIIDDPQHYSHGYQYFVTLSGDHEGWFAEHDLEELPLDGLPIWQSTEAFLRDLALIKQQARFTDGLYAYKASRTEFVPYQFRPVLKFLRNMHHRILIADEVGLGKTIEAALIYLELKARLNISRVLILCPSRLKAKWQDELRYRFEEDFVDLDSQAIRRFLDDTQRMGHTFPFKAIASFETMRSPAFIQAWSELHIPLDLLIVDEAHYLRNQETNTYELGLTLSDLADAVVFLTATPLHLGNQDLFNLLHILLPGDFPNRDVFTALIEPNTMINRAAALIGQGQLHEARRVLRSVEATSIQDRFLYNPYYHEILAQLGEGGSTRREQLVLKQDVLDLNTLSTVFTRTRKREVSQAAVRAAYSLEVQLNPHERAFYDAVLQHVQRELRQRFGKTPPFAMVMRERQAASCLIALREAILEAHQSPLDLRIEASTFDD
ncbi:MAG TPA: DEAD/DEAH box helicase, partial [Herpetosiphonaceae bacterium]